MQVCHTIFYPQDIFTFQIFTACPAFTDMYFDAAPIVRVAVEPAQACDMGKLIAGLKLLNQADPCVEVRVQVCDLCVEGLQSTPFNLRT